MLWCPPSIRGRILEKVIDSVLRQRRPEHWHCNLIVVDDGSTDRLVEHVFARYGTSVKVLSHGTNRGRSSARNTGWRSGNGSVVVFLDSDCFWRSDEALIAHVRTLEEGIDVSCGTIEGAGDGFWSIYENAVQERRIREFFLGAVSAMTTANCAFRRAALADVHGFDEAYRHYGFEDRDLLTRLRKQGARIAICFGAIAIHGGTLSLKQVSRKMMEAGQYSSKKFAEAHPAEYRESIYGRIDCHENGRMRRIFAVFAGHFVSMLAHVGDWIIGVPHLPFGVKRTWVRVISGVAYLVGTCRAR